MSFDFAALLSGLQKGLDTVHTLLPIATTLGAPTGLVEKVTNIAQATLETGNHIAQAVAEGTVVATSQDQDQLKSILARIEAENDALAEYIETH